MSVSEFSLDRGLPASPEAERNILGAILLDNNISDEVIAALRSEHFFLDAHRRIFQRIGDLFETSRPIDIVTLTEELLKHKELEACGGAGYLASLTDGVPRRSSLAHYVKIVKDKAMLRSMIHSANGVISQAFEQQVTAEEVLDGAESSIFNIRDEAEGDGEAVHVSTITGQIQTDIAQNRDANKEKSSLELTSGLEVLDRFTKGLFGGELTVIAAESGSGKTVIASQTTLANAREGTPVVWFSLEMSAKKLSRRFYPQMSEMITSEMMRDERLINIDEHVLELITLRQELDALPIWIDETSSIPLKKLLARIRMMKRKCLAETKAQKILFVIDYLQLVKANPNRQEAEGIKEIVFALRDLVKADPAMHILLISQFSKADGFTKKRQRSSADLYGSSAIRHAAQNILLISMEDAEKKERDEYLDCEIRIDKQRDGRKGKVSCLFDRDHLKFFSPQAALRI
jgi:replicative DNA helicase